MAKRKRRTAKTARQQAKPDRLGRLSIPLSTDEALWSALNVRPPADEKPASNKKPVKKKASKK